MADKMEVQEKRNTDSVKQVIREIATRFRPQRIYLYNLRHSASGDVKSFKLCMVLATGSREAAAVELYRHIDSPVPFDVLIYTPEEWEELSVQEGTFASTIVQTGLIVYG